MNIVIPSYKRADKLKGKDYFYMAKYVVPESQKDEYVEVVGEDRVITLPDNQDGNIVKKRNWILENIPRPLIMIDDDVESLYSFKEGVAKLIDKDSLLALFASCFTLADELECKMWGINVNTDPRSYYEMKPLSLTNVVLGPFQAHLEHDLKFDEDMGSKEDYDMSIQQLNKYKKILRFNCLAYDSEQQVNTGGICSFRTKDKEIEWCENIMRKWGSRIVKYNLPPKKLTDLRNGKVEIPIRGV